MNQTTLQEFCAPEKRVYELIEETLFNIIRKNYLHEKELKFQRCLGYWSITYLSAVIARVRFGKKLSYISIDIAAKPLLDEKKIRYGSTKSEPQLVRIFLNSPEDVINYLDIVAVSTQKVLDGIPKGFDCCSRYEACSDAMKCLQPDEQFRLDCGYRRILASGRVFYGKNKNI